MIELEIQGLSESREGLLIDVGRSVVASGFTLQRQRLTQDVNGILLTMVVRGPERKQRALEAALDANERLISFHTYPFEDGPPKPHYAAARKFARPPVGPAPPPVAETVVVATAAVAPKQPSVAAVAAAMPIAAVATVAPDMSHVAVASAASAAPRPASVASFFADTPVLPSVPQRPKPEVAPVVVAAPAPQEEEAEPEFVFYTPRASAPAPAPVAADPYIEVIPLGPDEDAVEKVVPKLLNGYPRIFHCLHSLESSVAPGARESSLQLAGQRTGAWVFERDYKPSAKLSLDEAMERIGIPALRALADVEYVGGQLRIRNSPLCKEGARSSCQFFIGYLQGLIGPLLASGGLSTFPLGCCSYGGDACVLAVSE
jgi:hypothetical protein